jgi:hypothetical protein
MQRLAGDAYGKMLQAAECQAARNKKPQARCACGQESDRTGISYRQAGADEQQRQ